MIANNGSVDDDVKNTNSTKQTKGEGKTSLRVEKIRRLGIEGRYEPATLGLNQI